MQSWVSEVLERAVLGGSLVLFAVYHIYLEKRLQCDLPDSNGDPDIELLPSYSKPSPLIPHMV